jgi:hypothetical protein
MGRDEGPMGVEVVIRTIDSETVGPTSSGTLRSMALTAVNRRWRLPLHRPSEHVSAHRSHLSCAIYAETKGLQIDHHFPENAIRFAKLF